MAKENIRYEITEVFGGVCWMIIKDGNRLNYDQGHFDDIYAVYRYIDNYLVPMYG